MTPKQPEQQYSEREAQERRDKALSAALSMGPIHHQESSPKKAKKPKKKTDK
jgi:hypothetical protein